MNINIEKLAKVIEKLDSIAKKSPHCDKDDFNAYDYSGGNYDDAYALGCDDGERLLAAEILEMLR
jgi:hypothetical protein